MQYFRYLNNSMTSCVIDQWCVRNCPFLPSFFCAFSLEVGRYPSVLHSCRDIMILYLLTVAKFGCLPNCPDLAIAHSLLHWPHRYCLAPLLSHRSSRLQCHNTLGSDKDGIMGFSLWNIFKVRIESRDTTFILSAPFLIKYPSIYVTR